MTNTTKRACVACHKPTALSAGMARGDAIMCLRCYDRLRIGNFMAGALTPVECLT